MASKSRTKLTLQELLGVYKEFSPEARAQRELLSAEVENAPLRREQLRQAVDAARLSNERVSVLNPIEIASATNANKLAARLFDPQVERAPLENAALSLGNARNEVELDLARRSLEARLKRGELENVALEKDTSLRQRTFDADRSDAAFDRERLNLELRLQGQAKKEQSALQLATTLGNLGTPGGLDDAQRVLSGAFPQVRQPLSDEARAGIQQFRTLEPALNGTAFKHYAPRVAGFVEKNPDAYDQLPAKAKLYYALYRSGIRSHEDMTHEQIKLLQPK